VRLDVLVLKLRIVRMFFVSPMMRLCPIFVHKVERKESVKKLHQHEDCDCLRYVIVYWDKS
jgi:hypothetical protein